MFVALEGIDGCGKTTQVKKIKAFLEQKGFKVHATSEPTHNPIGLFLREALKSQEIGEKALALLFAADRLDHLAQEIEPQLHSGNIVLCDRYVLSSLAYQSHVLPMDWVFEINRQARAPDLTLFFDITPETAAKRLANRKETSRFENLPRQQAVARAYREAMEKYPLLGRCAIIDAEAQINEVSRKTFASMETLLHI
jgi:dTMP kinase